VVYQTIKIWQAGNGNFPKQMANSFKFTVAWARSRQKKPHQTPFSRPIPRAGGDIASGQKATRN
jgi:hypothetical protein